MKDDGDDAPWSNLWLEGIWTTMTPKPASRPAMMSLVIHAQERGPELAREWPEQVVCAWIGNSSAAARRHDLQVTEEHLRRAAGMSDGTDEVAQKPAPQTHADSRIPSLAVCAAAKFDVKRDPATPCDYRMGDIGFGPMTSRV
jgi:hypothetical protein